MPADTKGNIQIRRDLLQIVYGVLLAGGLCEAADVKVFSPADQRAVCPAECHIGLSVIQQEGGCRHLGSLFGIKLTDVVAYAHVSKPGASYHEIHQQRRPGSEAGAGRQLLPTVGSEKIFTDGGERNRIPGDDSGKIGISQFGQNQIIRIIE